MGYVNSKGHPQAVGPARYRVDLTENIVRKVAYHCCLREKTRYFENSYYAHNEFKHFQGVQQQTYRNHPILLNFHRVSHDTVDLTHKYLGLISVFLGLFEHFEIKHKY